MPTTVAIDSAKRLERAIAEVLMAFEGAYSALPPRKQPYFDGYVREWLEEDFALTTRLEGVPKTVLGQMSDMVAVLRGERE